MRPLPTRSKPLAAPAWQGPGLTRLAMALMAIWPLQSLGQSAPRPVVPMPSAVPVPAASWRVNGSGAAAPVNTPNAKGGVDQRIDQTSNRAVYNWTSFDIGATSSVDFRMPDASSSALNRVLNSLQPSAIFGSLRSNGQVYLLNGNGILFGASARIDVGSLVASTLNIDNADFLSGLTDSIYGVRPSLKLDSAVLGAPAVGRGFVEVAAGAEIRSASGGRVFLFAEDVLNAGRIETPSGQTVLGAGTEVYLQAPTAERIYASEVNPQVPAVRGLLVEVGGGNGSVTNTGEIVTARGNTTLVGMAVNQSGRISATTSVSENGSVLLLARGNASALQQAAQVTKRATEGGVLTLGSGSVVEITPDTSRDAQGKLATSTEQSAFTASRIEMAGRTVEFEPGARVTAPSAALRVRAESRPDYEPPSGSLFSLDAPDTGRPDRLFDSSARLIVGRGVVLDVSGTTETEVSAGRNFVTTELLGASDLKDAPVQKGGPLYRSRVSFDLRAPVAILGDTSSYQKGIEKTVSERLATGGSVLLESTGVVSTHASSVIDVAGGAVRFTDAIVAPTTLLAEDGKRYTLNTAPVGLNYTGISNSASGLYDRWGPVVQWQASTRGRLEAGYVEGKSAGTLRVLGSQTILDGQLVAGATAGNRQLAGLDPLATGGRFQLGMAGNAAGTGVQSSVRLTVPEVPADVSINPILNPPRLLASDDDSRIAAITLQQAGFSNVSIASDLSVRSEAGADLRLPDRGGVVLYARGEQGISLQGDITAAGGSISAQTVANTLSAPATAPGQISVGAGVSLDVAGRLVNRQRDGVLAQSSTNGGSITLRSGAGLVLEEGSVLDVSGGASVATGGALSGGNAGALTLSSALVGGAAQRFDLRGELHGEALARGGNLSLRAATVEVGGNAVSDPGRGLLALAPEFFTAGGFASFNVDGILSNRVAEGTLLQPQQANRVAQADLRGAPTGARLADLAPLATLLDAQRRPTSLTLQSSGEASQPASGELVVGQGARIALDPAATLTLRAARSVLIDGTLSAPGGTVTIEQSGSVGGTAASDVLRLGEQSRIDVSGRVLTAPSPDGLARGEVQGGGAINLSAATLDWRPGSLLKADGTSARLQAGAAGTAWPEGASDIASDGGRLTVRIDAALGRDSTLGGSFSARAGGAQAAGGTLSVAVVQNDSNANVAPHTLVLQGQGAPAVLSEGKTITLDSALVRDAQVAELSLRSLDVLQLGGDISLALARRVRLDAPIIQLSQGADVRLSAASTFLGNTSARQGPGAATGGDGKLTIAARPTGSGASALASGAASSLDVVGNVVLSGAASAELVSSGDLRLHGVSVAGQPVGGLLVGGDLRLGAAQVYTTTATRFTLDASGHRIEISQPTDAANGVPATPLSAGSALTLKAAAIVQNGVLRAPLGSISLQASESIDLGAQSLTSVSGAGLSVPYGATVGGAGWYYGSSANAVTAPPDKRVDLDAPRVHIGERSVIDASTGLSRPAPSIDLGGGGELQASEFVAGPGGSRDIFAGAVAGAFAIVPAGAALAPLDRHIGEQVDASGAVANIPVGWQIVIERDIQVGGVTLAAGRYALLPAAYALLPGSFLVQPGAAGSAAPARGAAVLQPNGALLIGARLATSGTDQIDARPGSFTITPSALARESSEIRVTASQPYFSAAAQRNGDTVPRLAADAGTLNLRTQQLVLQGQLGFASSGRSGELNIASQDIVVSADTSGHGDALVLTPNQINRSGAGSVLLGGVRSQGSDGRRPCGGELRAVLLGSAQPR